MRVRQKGRARAVQLREPPCSVHNSTDIMVSTSAEQDRPCELVEQAWQDAGSAHGAGSRFGVCNGRKVKAAAWVLSNLGLINSQFICILELRQSPPWPHDAGGFNYISLLDSAHALLINLPRFVCDLRFKDRFTTNH